MEHKFSFDQLYLNRLKFDPSLKKMRLSFFVYRFRVIILMIALISVWGLYSFFKLPRESEPEVKIPIAVVSTVFPGAAPTDVEELITKKIETKISGISGIDTITSSSANSISSVVVQFNADQNIDDSIRKVRDAVSNIKNELPDSANDPVVNEVSLDDYPIMSLAISGPYDEFTLYDYAKDIKDELEKIPGVREIGIAGGNQREIKINYSPEKLNYYGISLAQANGAIQAANISVPSGNFDGSVYVYPVRVDGRVYNAQELQNLPVGNVSGSLIFLKDIASVRETSIEKTKISRISSAGQEPQNAVTLSVIKRTGGNIINTADEIEKSLDVFTKNIPGLEYDVIHNEAKFIEEDFNHLTRDFVITLSLVMGVLFLLIGLKEAFVAGLAIPLVFFITFGVMDLTGITLNFLSMFSLLLSLGLIVDDAIVVVSATKQYMRTGKFTPEEAVLLVLNDFKIVLTTTTLTTVWAFLPLLFAGGIMGQFLKSIPITVSVTLIASLAIALMVNHPLAAILERVRLTKNFFFFYCAALVGLAAIMLFQKNIFFAAGGLIILAAAGLLVYWYEKGGKAAIERNGVLVKMEAKNDDLVKEKMRGQENGNAKSISGRLLHGIINLNAILPLYEKYLVKLVDNSRLRKLFFAGITALFAVAAVLPILGVVKSEFFPADDYGFVYINIETPIGYKLSQTDSAVKSVEEKLLKYEEIDNFSTTVGSALSAMSMSGSGGSNKGSIIVNLIDKSKRSVKSYEFEETLRRDLAGIPNAKVTIVSFRGGPPGGSAFEARISGSNTSELQKIANDLKPMLQAIPGTVNAEISLKDSVPQYTFKLDQTKLAQNGLTAAYAGSILRTAISGTETTTILRDGEDIKVIAQFDPDLIPDLAAVQNLQIASPAGQTVYLKDIADISLDPSVENIRRVDQKRTALLTADITAYTTSEAVLADFEKKIASYKIPDGYEIAYGGATEIYAESVVSIIEAMGLAFVLIIATMVIQFNSFAKTAIVLITVPLALIGVFFGLAFLNIPLSFPGLVGILALFGIVVKNAIILIDKMNLNLSHGINFRDAVIDACKSRFEAIFITSFCTIIGIIPITLSSTTWQALGATIICGLSVSSFFTLFMVPALFISFVKDENSPDQNPPLRF
jgi:multidrug efflux pump subunit AcrB